MRKWVWVIGMQSKLARRMCEGVYRFTAERSRHVEDPAKDSIKANEVRCGGCGQFIND